jgi:DNA gyrase subunit A
MGTEQGEVKRTALSEFKNLRANGLNAFDLEPDDSLRWVHLTTGNDDVLMITQQGQAIRFPETNLRIASRNSGGVRGMALEGNDQIVGMEIAHPEEDVLVVGQHGYGKRTPIKEYTRHHRGGKGMIAMRVTEKTGVVADFKMVRPGDRLLISTSHGIVIRMTIDDIRQIGRATEGVRLIKLEEGDQVRAIERVQSSKESVKKAQSAEKSEQLAMMAGDGTLTPQSPAEEEDDVELETDEE